MAPRLTEFGGSLAVQAGLFEVEVALDAVESFVGDGAVVAEAYQGVALRDEELAGEALVVLRSLL